MNTEDDIEILNCINKIQKKLMKQSFITTDSQRSELIVRNARELVLLKKYREEVKIEIENTTLTNKKIV